MESMAALGQQPQSFAFLELVQAHRAITTFYQPLALPVLANRYRVYDRLLQAHGGDEPYGVVDAVLVQEIFIVIAISRGCRVRWISPGRPPGIGPCYDEADEEEKPREQCNDDDQRWRDAAVLAGMIRG